MSHHSGGTSLEHREWLEEDDDCASLDRTRGMNLTAWTQLLRRTQKQRRKNIFFRVQNFSNLDEILQRVDYDRIELHKSLLEFYCG